MSRGLGDPLVAAYQRCYLCRVGVQVAPAIKSHLLPNFHDFMATLPQTTGAHVQNQLAAERVEPAQYFALFVPAIDWLLQCVAYRAGAAVLEEVLGLCRAQGNNALLLNAVMASFPPEFISARGTLFTELIKQADDAGLPKHHLFRSLGVNVALHAPPADQRLAVLNDVWKVVMKFKDPAEYMACAEVWIEYPAKNFGKREVNAMLGDVVKHVGPDRAFERFYAQLQSILHQVLATVDDFACVSASARAGEGGAAGEDAAAPCPPAHAPRWSVHHTPAPVSPLSL